MHQPNLTTAHADTEITKMNIIIRLYRSGHNRWLGLFLLALSLLSPSAWAAIGVVTHVSGVLYVTKPGGQTRVLAPQSAVEEGDQLASEAKSFARVRFNDGGNLLVRPNSRITIERYSYEKDKPEADAVNVNLLKGGMRAITGIVGKRSMDKHQTTTATATVGIRGTHYGLQQCAGDCEGLQNNSGRPLEDGLHIDVLNGAVVASNSGGQQEFKTGQFGYVRDNQTKPEIVPGEQGFLASVPPSMAAPTGNGSTVGRDSNDNICVIR
jgi:hypothetical protein